MFLKGTLTSINVISSFMIGEKSPQNFSYQYSCLLFGRREDGGMLQCWVSRGTSICQLGLKYPHLIWHFLSVWAIQRDREETRERDGKNDTRWGWTCRCRTGPSLQKSLGRSSSWRRRRKLVVVKPKCKHHRHEHMCTSLTWYTYKPRWSEDFAVWF